MLNYFENINNVYLIVLIFTLIVVNISSLEYLAILKGDNEKKLPDWKIYFSVKSKLFNNSFFYFLCNTRIFRVLLIINIVISVLIFFVNPYSISWTILLFILSFIALVSNMRDSYGMDGSDQQKFAILIVLLLTTSFWTTDKIKLYGLIFICTQAYLTYFVAGFSKLLSKYWRNGQAVSSIFSTVSFGNQRVHKLTQNKYISFYLGWSAIILLLCFPITLFLPTTFMLIYLCLIFIFHLFNAILMGLNLFLWAYLANFPVIIYVHQNQHLIFECLNFLK